MIYTTISSNDHDDDREVTFHTSESTSEETYNCK
jgi:hypothetical protein